MFGNDVDKQQRKAERAKRKAEKEAQKAKHEEYRRKAEADMLDMKVSMYGTLH